LTCLPEALAAVEDKLCRTFMGRVLFEHWRQSSSTAMRPDWWSNSLPMRRTWP
jgi:hypothetical protein